MTAADLTRIDALLAAAREVEGCSDHGCVLRVYPRGGMGTNGGCGCVGRVRTDEGLTVQADRLDLVRLLTLARQTPSLVAEVRRLRAWGSVSETLAEDGNAMLGRTLTHAETFQRERDEARVEVERLLTENERLRARVEALASDLYLRFGAAGPGALAGPR